MKSSSPHNESTQEELIQECNAMIRHLSDRGLRIPAKASVIIDYDQNKSNEITNAELIKIHYTLAKTVAPAIPASIRYLYVESLKDHLFNFLGCIGLIRRTMLVAILSLTLFITLSLSSNINQKTVTEGILDNSGIILLLNLLLFISAASLGASFSNLFQANRYIKQSSYNPKYETSYWIKYIVGIISGLLLAVLMPIKQIEGSNVTISIPLLAILGGFSSNLVYKILNRLVFTIETLIQGSGEQKNESFNDRINPSLNQAKNESNIEYLTSLYNIKTSLDNESKEQAIYKIEQLIEEINSN